MEEMKEGDRICPHCGYGAEQQNAAGLLPAGTVLLGRYIVGKAIGNGGFGVTYIGLDGQLKRKIAIKEFFPNKLTSRTADGVRVTVRSGAEAGRFQNGLEMFLSEAKHLARLSHIPGIVYIYNYFHENGTGYIIMEYLDGMDLLRFLREHGGKIPYKEARKLILSVLYILRNVHMNGILHRDIAPDNVFITTDNVVKLIDFGAARHATRGADDSAEIMLKVGYAPVEQYSLDGAQGAWTDMYEVGALFYRMITGIKPVASIDRMVNDRLVIPSEMGIELPPEAEAAIMTSLNVDGRYRIQSARDYMEALGGKDFKPTEWTVETTVFEGDIEEKSRFFTRRRVAVLFAVCLLILAGGIGTAVAVRQDVSVVATNVMMQNVTGMNEAAAREVLAKQGVKSINTIYIYRPEKADLVEYQNPEEGASISEETAVTLTVASSRYVTLPELEPGKEEYEEVEKEFRERGITVSRIEAGSDIIQEGMVIGYFDRNSGDVADVSNPLQLLVSTGNNSDGEE